MKLIFWSGFLFGLSSILLAVAFGVPYIRQGGRIDVCGECRASYGVCNPAGYKYVCRDNNWVHELEVISGH